MSMLSSVADRLYWMSRYLERAEDTARLTNAYTQFILDIPKGSEPGWESLVDIIDGQEIFEQRYKNYNERNVMKFLIADIDNTGSILHSVKAARENVRTTRDVLPEQCWELINELYLYVSNNAKNSLSRKSRFEFLDQILAQSKQITGLIESSLSRDHAYRFMRMGRLIERADMTSRGVDVATATVRDKRSETEDGSWLWGHMLHSLSAVTAYRRQVGPMIEANDVVNFVFKNAEFPRSMLFCLSTLRRDIKDLKNHEAVEKVVVSMSRKLSRFEAEKLSSQDLHLYIDKFQEQLNRLNFVVYQSWFSR